MKYNIKRILTLCPEEPPKQYDGIVYKNQQLKQDVLKQFDTCFNFIDEGRKNGENVLVHWYADIIEN